MPRIAARDGCRALAARMIYDAVNDMRDTRVQSAKQKRQGQKAGNYGREQHRRSATLWLASKAAARWFDHVGVDQTTGLHAVGWAQHARELLAGEVTPVERTVLAMGVEAVSAGHG